MKFEISLIDRSAGTSPFAREVSLGREKALADTRIQIKFEFLLIKSHWRKAAMQASRLRSSHFCDQLGG